MGEEKTCPVFRKLAGPNVEKKTGYCGLAGHIMICQGDVHFCKKPDQLLGFLRKKSKEHIVSQTSLLGINIKAKGYLVGLAGLERKFKK
jgi:hypothetical protein